MTIHSPRLQMPTRSQPRRTAVHQLPSTGGRAASIHQHSHGLSNHQCSRSCRRPNGSSGGWRPKIRINRHECRGRRRAKGRGRRRGKGRGRDRDRRRCKGFRRQQLHHRRGWSNRCVRWLHRARGRSSRHHHHPRKYGRYRGRTSKNRGHEHRHRSRKKRGALIGPCSNRTSTSPRWHRRTRRRRPAPKRRRSSHTSSRRSTGTVSTCKLVRVEQLLLTFCEANTPLIEMK
mmetsp:Transcript_35287/g.94509  ORF Transcript_35287/g.94509 Transcript_35287/m.94509 type:complete len:231 (-) Transcript_35287:231-923(-)